MKVSAAPPLAKPFRRHPSSARGRRILTVAIALALSIPAAFADPNIAVDFAWEANSSTIWGSTGGGAAVNWAPDAPSGGPDAAGLYVTMTNSISSARIITLQTSGNDGTAAKTIGRLDIGDTDATPHSFTIQAGTGLGVLDFNGNGGSAILNQVAGSAANSITAPISLSTALNIGNASSNTLTLSGLISGGNSITVNSTGAGSVDFTSSGAGTTATYSGGTTLTAGTIRVANSSGAGDGPLGTGTITLNGGTLAATTASTRTLSNAVTLGGNVTIGQAVTGTGVITLSGTTTLTANRTVTTDGLGLTITGSVTDGASSFSLTKNGAGTLRIGTTGANFDGGLNIDAGTLFNSSAAGTSALGTGLITFGNGTTYQATTSTNLSSNIELKGALTHFVGNAANNTLSGTISDAATFTGSYVAQGSGNQTTATLTLSNTNTYSGGTTIQNTGVGDANSAARTAVTRLNANGTNALGSGVVTLTSDETFTGANAGASTGAAVLTLGADQTVAGLSGVIVAQNSSRVESVSTTVRTLTLNGASGTNSYAGAIGGGTPSTNAVALVKTGASIQILSGTNSYTGPTTVSGGTLEISGSINATAGTGIKIDSTGTLLLSGGSERVNSAAAVNLNGGTLAYASALPAGTDETLGTLTLSSNSTIDFGNASSGGLDFAFSGWVAHTSGASTLTIANWNGNFGALGTDNTHDRLLFTGTASDFELQFGQNDIAFSGFGPGYDAIQFGGQFEIVPVPEPSATALLGAMALVGFIGFRERRRLFGR